MTSAVVHLICRAVELTKIKEETKKKKCTHEHVSKGVCLNCGEKI